VSARIPDRLGPTRVGGRFGWLQSLADGIKLIQKEDLAPQAADKMLFRVAPYIVVVASFAVFMFLPFSEDWVAVSLDVGLFIALAVLSLEVLGIVLAGYSSGSKWALFGGMRETAQMVSYEVPLGITAVIPVAIAGTMNLGEIVQLQSGCLSNWFLFRDPFTFLAFFVFFTVTLASNKRAPFDLAEAESELVAGFHTEYSGMRWSFFFLAEYASMYFVSALAAILFLGGWWTGLGSFDQWVATNIHGYAARVLGFVVLLVKAGLLVNVQIWIRWTLPRLRIDQVMTTCLKYLVPISCFLFLASTVWTLFLPGRTAFGFSTRLGERMPAAKVTDSRASEPRPSGSAALPRPDAHSMLASQPSLPHGRGSEETN
jgi:NADH-quinone oxidoreductase subunit H